ncbi:hypothetical protein GCM10009530_14360 [Microbispora corallina]|uniref:hypothetical protein n=1 Tax=Microbispora corallina TaxID=83302 RepID=UPI00194F8E06|nr:hypothetical protein [Microbispora corallina]
MLLLLLLLLLLASRPLLLLLLLLLLGAVVPTSLLLLLLLLLLGSVVPASLLLLLLLLLLLRPVVVTVVPVVASVATTGPSVVGRLRDGQRVRGLRRHRGGHDEGRQGHRARGESFLEHGITPYCDGRGPGRTGAYGAPDQYPGSGGLTRPGSCFAR